jgi:YVTN family beta-propeller protein
LDGNTVSVIDGTTNAVTVTVTVGSEPVGIAFVSSTNRIYIANDNYPGSISVFKR